ncbi:MAG: GAF domain-containing sensor histidine kinase [Elusimicrobiales bacterium]
MIAPLFIFLSAFFVSFWYIRFRYVLPLHKKIEEYNKFYLSFEDFIESILSTAVSFRKEDYLNLTNIILIKFNNIVSDASFYIVEKKEDNVSIIGAINKGNFNMDPSKIKDIVFSAKDELSYIERADIFEEEKKHFAVISLNDGLKNISIVAMINEEDKDTVLRYFRFILLFLKTFLNYYTEIEERNREIKKLKAELDGIIKELESQETKLIKKHKEARLIYEGISTISCELENPASYLIELIYRTITPQFVVCFGYSNEDNKLVALFTQPSNIQIDYRVDLTEEQSPLTKVFINANPMYITDEQDIRSIPFVKDTNSQTLLIFPVMTAKRKYGVIVISDSKKRKYSQDDLSLIEIYSKQLALFMNLSDLYSKISQYAIKMESLNKIKDEFIASVNHEIKTPLTTIKGFLSVLLNGDAGSLNDQQIAFLNLVDQATNRLINIVTNLLDISKLTSKADIEMEKADLIETINTLLPSLRMKAYSKNIRIIFNSEIKNAMIKMDKHWIAQVINNLVDNAIKYSMPSSVVNISVYDKGDVVIFCVEDHGYGIDEEDKKFIFEKFFRGKNVSLNTQGSGLGLAITKTIIEKHNGKVWFESEKGKGSKFYFALKKTE